MTYFKTVSYDIVKLFVTQFVMGIYGVVVTAALRNNAALSLTVGILSVILYFFLIYSQMWEMGGRDRIRTDAGRAEKDFFRPLMMGVFANIPNFVFVIAEIAVHFINNGIATNNVPHVVNSLLQSYYLGIINALGLQGNPFTFAVTAFISVFVIFSAYVFGYKGMLKPPLTGPKKKNQKR